MDRKELDKFLSIRNVLDYKVEDDLNSLLEIDHPNGLVESRYDDHTEWRLGGVLHRTDGPAWIGIDGSEMWYEQGALLKSKLSDGTMEWRTTFFNKNVFHRTDGPALIRADGSQEWYVQGVLHREDGPAVILPWVVTNTIYNSTVPGKTESYYLKGHKLPDEEHYRIALGILSGELFEKIPLYINNDVLKYFCEEKLK